MLEKQYLNGATETIERRNLEKWVRQTVQHIVFSYVHMKIGESLVVDSLEISRYQYSQFTLLHLYDFHNIGNHFLLKKY